MEIKVGDRTFPIKERICIAGFCQTSRDLVPYGDDRYTIVGLNRGAIFMERADVWYDLHSPLIRGWQHRRPGKHLQFLQNFNGPVYLHETDPEIPNSVRYPLEDVQANLGVNLFRMAQDGTRSDSLTRPYFDSSIAYELGLAITWQPKEILLVGVDLNTNSEYVFQRSGVSYLLGLAQGRGIDVVLPDNCPLLTGQLYGRGYLADGGEHMSAAQLETRFKALKEELDAFVGELHRLQGQHQAMQFVLDQMVPGLDHEKMDQRRVKIERAIAEMTAKVQSTQGQVQELLHWIHQTPDGMSQDEAQRQMEARELRETDIQLNGYHRNGGEELSEGDLSAFAALDEPEPVGVN